MVGEKTAKNFWGLLYFAAPGTCTKFAALAQLRYTCGVRPIVYSRGNSQEMYSDILQQQQQQEQDAD